MKMVICVATMRDPQETVYPGDIPLAMINANWEPSLLCRFNTPEDNLGVVGSYQWLYENTTEEILCFMHDDVIVRERGWHERVLREFEDERVGVLGFGGARWHGTPDLYKVPYLLNNLRRGDYLSNVDDAEVHGSRFTDATDVAVLDGFVLVVRRSLLDRCAGWASIKAGFFCYDYSICAIARRLGFTVRCVGIRCHHRGGGTSVGKNNPHTTQEEYDRSHRWFYEEFRDVMPYDVRHEAVSHIHNAT